ncbi:MAG: ATP phosphoribosyltransferase [Candidatus Methylarchaceae archaeon HK02M2]|nr:ATP phosphoribosyltransferase [Candidatus Methylarchaceae archaeon HK02M2]
MKRVNFALPKGSLGSTTYEFLDRAGYKLSGQERTYRPSINDPMVEPRILRPQEIPIYVAEGLQDIGITGIDWIKETRSDVEVLLDLEYGAIKMVIAIPKPWTTINSLSQLIKNFWKDKKELRTSTEYLNTTVAYFKSNPNYQKYYGNLDPLVITPWWRIGNNPKVNIFLSFGATEAKPPETADAIVDVTETGTTLEQNDLKIIEEIGISTAHLIANKEALKDPEKKEKIYDILTLLKGVVDGRKKLHIFVNVSETKLPKLLKQLPALKRPTISPLSEKGWYSVNTVIEKGIFIELLPKLRRLAQGLIVYEPRQVLSLNEVPNAKKGDLP